MTQTPRLAATGQQVATAAALGTPGWSPSPLAPLVRAVIGLLLSLGGMNVANPQPHTAYQRVLYSLAKGINTVFDPPPPAGSPTVGTPDPVSGVVAGSLGFPTGAGLTFTATDPAQGSVEVAAGGGFVYTPTQQARQSAGAETTDTFTATAHNGLATTTIAVTVPVDPGTPVTGQATVGVPTIQTGVVGGAAAFTDTAGRALTYDVPAVSTGGGAVSVDAATGVFSFTPTDAQRQAAGLTTTDSFTVTASNGVRIATQTVTVAVDPGTPIPGTATVGTPSPDTGVVTGAAMFTDTAGRILTYSTSRTSASGGALSLDSATGVFTYTPTDAQRQSATAATTDSFTVTASNGVRAATETVTVVVASAAPVDQPPVAADPGFSITALNPFTGVVSGVVDVSDPDGDALTYRLSAPPDAAVGVVVVDSQSGSWAFKPTPQARLDAWLAATPVTAGFSISACDGQASVAVAVSAPVDPAADFAASVLDAETSSGGTVVALGGDGTVYVDASDGLSVINRDGSAGAPISLGFRPWDAVVGPDGRIYATDYWGDTGVVVADPAGGQLRAVFAPITGAAGLAFGPDGRLYVTSLDQQTLSVLTSDGQIADNVDLGAGAYPTDVAVGPDGSIYVTDFSEDYGSTRLTLRNPDGTIAATLYTSDSAPLGDYTSTLGVAVDGHGAVYLADGNHDILTVFNPDGTSSVTSADATRGIALGADGRVYLAGFDTGSTTVLTPIPVADTAFYSTTDLDTGVVSGGLNLLDPAGRLTYTLSTAVPAAVGTVAVDPATGQWTFTPTPQAGFAAWQAGHDGTAAFTITASDGTTVAVSAPVTALVDLHTEVRGFVGTPGALALGADGTISGGNLYVADPVNNTVTVLELATGVTIPLNVDESPYALAASPDGTYVAVSNGADNTLRIIWAGAFSQDSYTLDAHADPIGAIAFDQQGRFYIASPTASTVTVYDNLTFSAENTLQATLAHTIDVTNPTGLAVGADGRIFVVGQDNNGVGYLNIYRPDATFDSSWTIGGQPNGIAVTPNGHLAITDMGGPVRDFALVTADGASSATFTLGAPSWGIAAGPDGRLYLANPNDGTITTVTPIPVGAGTGVFEAAAVIDTVDDTTGVVTGHLTVAAAGVGPLTYAIGTPPLDAFGQAVIDPETGVFTFTPTTQALVYAYSQGAGLTAEFTVTAADGVTVVPVAVSAPVGVPADALAGILARSGSYPSGVAVGADGTVYVINAGANTVSVLDPDATAIRSTVHVGASPSAVRVGPDGRVWVANGADNTVTVLDPTTTITATIAVGTAPTGLAFGADGSVFVANTADGTLSVINPTTNTVDRTITVGGTPIGIAAGPDGRIYVTDFTGNAVTVIDPAQGEALTTIDATVANAYGIVVDNSGTIYLTHPLSNSVSVLTPTAVGYSTRTAPVGATPTAIALGVNGIIYVTDSGANTVTAIDPHTLLTSTLATGVNPNSIAAGPDGNLYITNGGSDTLTAIHLDDSSATTTPVGVDTSTVTVDTHGYLTVTSNYDNSFSVIRRPGTGGVIATGTDTTGVVTRGTTTGAATTIVTGAIPAGSYPSGVVVSPDSRYAYLANYDGTVSILNPAAGTATTVTVGYWQGPVVVSPDSRYAYVDGLDVAGNSTVSIINPATGTATAIATGSRGYLTSGVVVSPDGRYAYVVYGEEAGALPSGGYRYDRSVSIINPATGTATTIHAGLGRSYYADGGRLPDVVVSPDSRYAYVSNQYDNTVSIINPATGTATTIPTGLTIPTSRYPAGVAVSPDSRYAYVHDPEAGTVSILNPVTGTATTIATGPAVTWNADPALAISPDGRYVYVSNRYDNTVSIINPATGTATTIPVGSYPGPVAVSPDSGYAYLANYNEGTVSILNPATGTATTTTVGWAPVFVAASPDSRYAYVTSSTDDTVSILNPATGTATTIPVTDVTDWAAVVSPDSRYAYVRGWDGSVTVIDSTKVVSQPSRIAPDYRANTLVDTPVTMYPVSNPFVPDTGVTITGLSSPAHGTAVFSGTKITYTPNNDYTGTDTFTYTATDGVGTGTGTITVQVDPVHTSVPYTPGPTGTKDLYSTLRWAMDDKDEYGDNHLTHGVYTQHVLVDGNQALIVYIAGTQAFFTGDQSAIRNLPSAIGIVDEDQIRVIKDATRPDEPILLVGFSQGGMDAQNIAAYAGDYGLKDQIKAVVTYGSPLVQIDKYPTVHMEDPLDNVPKLVLPSGKNWASGLVNSAINRNVYLQWTTNDFKKSVLEDGSTWGVHGNLETYKEIGLLFDVDNSSHWDGVKDALDGFLWGRIVPDGYTVIGGELVQVGTPPSTQF